MFLKCLYDSGNTIHRVLAVHDDVVLAIDCIKRTMPVWLSKERLTDWHQIDEKLLHEKSGIRLVEEESLSRDALSVASASKL